MVPVEKFGCFVFKWNESVPIDVYHRLCLFFFCQLNGARYAFWCSGEMGKVFRSAEKPSICERYFDTTRVECVPCLVWSPESNRSWKIVNLCHKSPRIDDTSSMIIHLVKQYVLRIMNVFSDGMNEM
jgi:hypothetical protein